MFSTKKEMKDQLETLIDSKPKSLPSKSSNICPDYDDECVDVHDPLSCWMGNECLERAKGLCPLIHTDN
jgi:hypothetical protein